MKKTMTMEVTVQVPMTPNYIGVGEEKMVGIEEFSEQELREIGAAWIEDLVAKADDRRKRKSAA